MVAPSDRRLLQGARQIAGYVLGDEKFEKRIYELRGELPIFKIGHLLCAFEDGIDAALARKEAAAERALVCAPKSDA